MLPTPATVTSTSTQSLCWYMHITCIIVYHIESWFSPPHSAVPPVITSPFFTASLQEKGSEFTADCDASGMRPPIYSWSFNGVVISSPSSGRFSVDQNTGVLTILELTFSDTGSYTCVASNSIGTDQQANSIVVFGKC